jgi:hypothetical protein
MHSVFWFENLKEDLDVDGMIIRMNEGSRRGRCEVDACGLG